MSLDLIKALFYLQTLFDGALIVPQLRLQFAVDVLDVDATGLLLDGFSLWGRLGLGGLLVSHINLVYVVEKNLAGAQVALLMHRLYLLWHEGRLGPAILCLES